MKLARKKRMRVGSASRRVSAIFHLAAATQILASGEKTLTKAEKEANLINSPA